MGMTMESSKCPKCGEEPAFIEHIEKWYCYGCNSYIDECEDNHECIAKVANEDPAAAIAHELKSLEEDEAKLECRNCGAELEDLKDGRLYCFVCETYQDEIVAGAKEEPRQNEAQTLLDAVTVPVAEKAPEPVQPVLEVKPEAATVVCEPAKESEILPQLEPKPSEIKMCPSCSQPLKFIEKYQRHYCYGCRKYAPREETTKPPASIAKSEEVAKKCPDCSGEMKFIEKYSEYYCYSCKKYPLRSQKKTEPAKPAANAKALACPKCGEPVKWVEKYSRHYCYKCKDYAPKGFGGMPVDAGEKKECPTCKEVMKFIPEYNEWYCLKCKKYSLRPSKPVLLF
jgi:ribosomal protein S27AE